MRLPDNRIAAAVTTTAGRTIIGADQTSHKRMPQVGIRTVAGMALPLVLLLQLGLLAWLVCPAAALRSLSTPISPDVSCHHHVYGLMNAGQHQETVAAAESCMHSGVSDVCPAETCPPDGHSVPSLSFMQGIALYRLGMLPQSTAAFARALVSHPGSRAAWQNLGDVLLYQFRLQEAAWAYLEAITAHNMTEIMPKVRSLQRRRLVQRWACFLPGPPLVFAAPLILLGALSCVSTALESQAVDV